MSKASPSADGRPGPAAEWEGLGEAAGDCPQRGGTRRGPWPRGGGWRQRHEGKSGKPALVADRQTQEVSEEVSDRDGREERVPVAVFLSLPEVGPARSERGSGGKSAGPRISGVAHRTLRLSGGEALEKERRVALARGVCFSSVLKVWPVRKAVGGE